MQISNETIASCHYDLDTFEGPLDYLVYLIQRNEIDINGIHLRKIVDQFLAIWKCADMDSGAEFIGSTASLVYLKSRMLLPRPAQDALDLDENDPNFSVIHQLVEYCKFKQAAKILAEKEQQQSSYFVRGETAFDCSDAGKLSTIPVGIEEFRTIFQALLQKQASQKGLLTRDVWKVSDKIHYLKECKLRKKEIAIGELFNAGMCKEELIVTFLATLELIKIGDVKICKVSETDELWLIFSA